MAIADWRLNDVYLQYPLTDTELSAALAQALSIGEEEIAVVTDWAQLSADAATRPVKVLRSVMNGEFPLRLDIQFSRDGSLAGVDEGAAIQALAEHAGSSLLIDDPAVPAQANAFILVYGFGHSRPVLADNDAIYADPPALRLMDPDPPSVSRINAFGLHAVITANPSAEWLDPGMPLPVDGHWPRSEVRPLPGTGRRVELTTEAGGAPAVGDQLWLLFIPALGAINGWEDFPETIEDSAFVQCRVMAIEARGEFRTWLMIAIEDVIPFPQLRHRLAPQRLDYLETWGHARGVLTRFDGWALLSAPIDDFGFWLLAWPDKREVHVVACGEWGLDYDVVWAGHVIITAEEWARICRRG